MDSCYLCGTKHFFKKRNRVRDDANLEVLECPLCGLVFLSSFGHIVEGFYENSQMHIENINIEKWVQETAEDDDRRFYTFQSLINNKTILDFGCGNGGFLSRAAQVTSKAVGIELEKRLKTYFQNKQLSVYSNLNEIDQHFDVITLFHVLEHIPDPISLLKQLADKLNSGGCIIIEVPNANDALLSLYESDAFSDFTYWSCHLFLFNPNTLTLLAKKAELKINYIKQVQRYSLSNHLYWLAKHKPKGHVLWGFLDSKELYNAYEKQLGLINCCDTLIASLGMNNE
jgi:2-polyprenyl-3-methyl-5-hydroxy-6-metoxy-1,4-benzoquinol methylase